VPLDRRAKIPKKTLTRTSCTWTRSQRSWTEMLAFPPTANFVTRSDTMTVYETKPSTESSAPSTAPTQIGIRHPGWSTDEPGWLDSIR